MTHIEMQLTFTGPDDTKRTEYRCIEVPGDVGPGGDRRLTHVLFSNLRVFASEQDDPKHSAVARKWLDFPKRPVGFERYFDVLNSQALWLEISNLVMGAEADLILAQAFKAIEPEEEPNFEDDDGISDLFFVHDRKMMLLNQAVHSLIKVQDLVNRLLHESLGGDLVDTNNPNWEIRQLNRKSVVEGLEEKCAAGALTLPDLQKIRVALGIPESTPNGQIARNYRNRLAHHARPSVDYPMFFSTVESRQGTEIKDASGKIIGRLQTLSVRRAADYRFYDLHSSFSDYLAAVVEMLQKLSEIEILHS